MAISFDSPVSLKQHPFFRNTHLEELAMRAKTGPPFLLSRIDTTLMEGCLKGRPAIPLAFHPYDPKTEIALHTTFPPDGELIWI